MVRSLPPVEGAVRAVPGEAAEAGWVSGALSCAHRAVSPRPFCSPEPLCLANGASDVSDAISCIVFNCLALCLAQDQLLYSE